jgi:hypothetical protein
MRWRHFRNYYQDFLPEAGLRVEPHFGQNFFPFRFIIGASRLICAAEGVMRTFCPLGQLGLVTFRVAGEL